MKRKEFELEWFVYVHGFNCNGFQKMNIFNNFRFNNFYNYICYFSWFNTIYAIIYCIFF